MASDFEDDEDLASLRNAALASLNVRSAQPSPLTVNDQQDESNKSKEEVNDEDDNLEALRLAALKTKKAVVPQAVTPQPRGTSQVLSEASGNSVCGNNLISIPLVDTQETNTKETVVPEVKKEVRNDKFSRFQSDSESEEEEEEDVDSIPEIEPSESSADEVADEVDGSEDSDSESIEQSSTDGEPEKSDSDELESDNSSDTESSTSSSESEQLSSEENEEPSKNIIEKTSEKQNGAVDPKPENNKHATADPSSNVKSNKTIDLRNHLRNRKRNDHVEERNRYKAHVTSQIVSRGPSRSYDQRNSRSDGEREWYRRNHDRKRNNVDREERRREYDRQPRNDIGKRDRYNHKEKDNKIIATISNESTSILDRRKSSKSKVNSRVPSDTLKKQEKLVKEEEVLATTKASLSDSDSDIDTDSRFKQSKNERIGDQIVNAPSRIITSMQLNVNVRPNFGRQTDHHRDRRKDHDLRYASRSDKRVENRRNEPYRKETYFDKTHESTRKKHDHRENNTRERSRDAVQSREFDFVDDSDDEMNKKGLRSFVHSKRQTESKVEKRKSNEHRKNDSIKLKNKSSLNERTDNYRSKENQPRKSKSESSIKFLKKVKKLDVGDESKTTGVSVVFDNDPEKFVKKSKKSLHERLGKTVSKHKASVKLRLGCKDELSSNAWDSDVNSEQDARKFVTKDNGKAKKSVKERLKLKRTSDETDVDLPLEPSRKIVRTSKSDSAVDRMSAEEKLKRKKKEEEIQEKIRKIEERNLASSKKTAKNNEIDLAKNSENKDKELELKIRRIQEKNAAILKRQREIEEDKEKYGKNFNVRSFVLSSKIHERLGKTVSKHKASVKLRLGCKDELSSNAWDSDVNSEQDARKFVTKDNGKAKKSVKERLKLKRTSDETDVDLPLEPSRKIVRTSKSDSAVDRMSAEEKLKRKKKEEEIQEKIRKIEERNLASSKKTAKNNEIDLAKNSENKDKELELKIRRIQEKNAAILKRQREIEEDKEKYGK
ncbi:uncharacterized protein [Antedon mediterranea]|uniref:uncharacterized protein n=1 Tax=Antedon mediterranea TaxID=105859 RepID=UPI003AF91155